jgi:fucokinase
MPPPFPFQHVIISFPDERAATSTPRDHLAALSNAFATTITSTCDPYNLRVGSGGGTLAALESISENDDSSILIIHAGGQASRCSTQMVLGKAWTSLPVQDNKITTPIELWLQQCAQLFQTLPRSSIVIVASDTLLLLEENQQEETVHWNSWNNITMSPAAAAASSVIGLAVPAPLKTATHHGVYRINEPAETQIQIQHQQTRPSTQMIVPCHQVLQKPSMEILKEHCTNSNNNNNNNTATAWIDTGVCIFLPQAAHALRQLVEQLPCCTAKGLKQLAGGTTSVQQHAVSVDLYTHMLHALQVTSHSKSLQEYCDTFPELPVSVATSIFEALSPCCLNVWCQAEGKFLHLGTTRELMDFLVQGSTIEDDDKEKDLSATQSFCLLRQFGRALQLSKRVESFATQSEIDTSAVLLQCLLKSGDGDTIVGAGSVIEHSHCETTAATRIGHNCLVSGLRQYGSGVARSGLELPDNMILQQIALDEQASEHHLVPTDDKAKSFVYMLLGVDDSVKEKSTVYGRSMKEFLHWADLQEVDLWEDTTANNTLWNAKIHPVVTKESLSDIFGWLSLFLSGQIRDTLPESLLRWKALRRLSLSEIRDCSDASAEFSFRNNLSNVIAMQKEMHFAQVRKIILTRQHRTVDLRFFVDSCAAAKGSGRLPGDVLKVMAVLDDVFEEAMADDLYDICGRVAMISSAFQAAVAPYMPTTVVEGPIAPVSDADGLVSFDASNTDMPGDFRRFVKQRNHSLRTMPHATLVKSSAIMESMAHTMTQRCVGDTRCLNLQCTRKLPPVYEQWVHATAPARIDLGGGWSDTPPVCFEFGSAVTGIAVLVDGIKPLSCRCRVVKGSTGIILRTEHRDGQASDKLSATESKLSSLQALQDYNVPTADCALLKCALVCLGMVSLHDLNTADEELQPFINRFCQSESDVGLEVISTSLLPHGSGMGTSSILGGCVLASIGRAVGMDLCGDDQCCGPLIDAVLQLEQLLSTGGGFQDQVNGLVAGYKHETCNPLEFPLKVVVKRLPVAADVTTTLNDNLILLFTGKTRLAKNILQNVLRRWATRTNEITATVASLVKNANDCQDALLTGNINLLGECLSHYWSLKKTMAGHGSGVEPPFVNRVISVLRQQGLIRGASLCGAGGGGFMVLLKQDHASIEDIQTALREDMGDGVFDAQQVSWHSCRICEQGLSIHVLQS